MPYNAVRDVVNRYVAACQLYDDVVLNAIRMNDLVGVFGMGDLSFSLESDKKDDCVANFKVELQKKAWGWIFKKMNMGKYMTQSLKEEINAAVEKQKNVPFKMSNIYKMFEMVVGTHGDRMNKVYIEVFDRITKHHHANRHNLEGWKTNSHYMVKEKFILDNVLDSFNLKWDSYPSVSHRYSLMDDFTKALNYMTGQNYDFCLRQFFSTQTERNENGDRVRVGMKEFGKWYDWGYFTVKVFKKGSMHVKFNDRKVWEQFNRTVATAKGFELPESV